MAFPSPIEMALPSSSSNPLRRWKYDVFLSLRGEDTRTNFTSFLYAALKGAGIHVFRDNNELERGQEIGPELLKTIEDSRFAIIVFSRNYASSTWCLDELAHIMECKRTLGLKVLPVFYDVEPSDVRKQKRNFEEAFAGYEELFKEEMKKLQRWRDALKEAADLKGVDVRNDADRHQSTIVDGIVKEILDNLEPKRLSVAINPIGLHSRADAVISLLYDEPIDVCIVGIYGMGGIGKTTIAKEVYNSIFLKFEGSCFLPSVRENSDPKGKVCLQKQLLSEILKGKHEKIYSEDRGRKVIEERLCSMRVLIVLDDVDELRQINNILGNRNWLCPGSRIIITTRTEDLLKPSGDYRQYQVKELDHDESLQLFSINAFEQWHPMKEYMECAKSVVHYAGGNPLALEVLGSSLRGVSFDVWEDKLEQLKAIPAKDIQEKLKISYYSLCDTDQYLFLDIACFFIGKDKDLVISILNGCRNFHPKSGIHTLIKRCLVKIDSHNKLMIHDLLRDMGREIVRQEYPQEPGNRSRVWHDDDARDLLTDETGTEAVQGLNLNLPAGSSESWSTDAFRRMIKLRLLQLNSVHLTGSYKNISKKLLWLCWQEFPLESIPDDLHLGNVVALDMRSSSLKQVWEGVKLLPKLKFLDLSYSCELIETPNFEGLCNLEIIMLKGCTSLVGVHKSIGCLTKLVILNLRDCRNLKNLPRSICELRSLENLIISGCSKLDELPEEQGNMESVVVRAVDGIAISGLLKIPLRPIFTSFLPVSLRKLDVSYLNLFDDMIPDDLHLPSLEYLKLCGNNLSSLPASVGLLPKLSCLWLNECKGLQSVPVLQSSLLELQAVNCTLLERINLTNCQERIELNLKGCHKLVEIESFFKLEPDGVEIFKKLMAAHGLSIEASIESVRWHMINHLTETYRVSPLQGLSTNGIFSICVPGREIPSWFSHQSEGNSVTFNVPPLQDCKIVGLIICAVYALEDLSAKYSVFPEIEIRNKTKIWTWYHYPITSFFLSDATEDVIWLSYWRLENPMDRTGDEDMNQRFQYKMEGGDQVEVLVTVFKQTRMAVPPQAVKKCGIHLLYQQNDQELAIIPATCRHYRTFRCFLYTWPFGIGKCYVPTEGPPRPVSFNLVKKCGVRLLYQQNDQELAMIPSTSTHHRKSRYFQYTWPFADYCLS